MKIGIEEIVNLSKAGFNAKEIEKIDVVLSKKNTPILEIKTRKRRKSKHGNNGKIALIKQIIEENTSPLGITCKEITQRLNESGVKIKNSGTSSALHYLAKNTSRMRRIKRYNKLNKKEIWHYYKK